MFLYTLQFHWYLLKNLNWWFLNLLVCLLVLVFLLMYNNCKACCCFCLLMNVGSLSLFEGCCRGDCHPVDRRSELLEGSFLIYWVLLNQYGEMYVLTFNLKELNLKLFHCYMPVDKVWNLFHLVQKWEYLSVVEIIFWKFWFL